MTQLQVKAFGKLQLQHGERVLAACHRLVIPGGQACVITLLADPRIHQLLETTLNAGGFAVAGSLAQEFLANIGTDSPGNRLNILVQDSPSPDDFIE